MSIALPALCFTMLKQSQQTGWDRFQTNHPWLHTLGWFNPFTAAPVAGMDSINEFRKGNYGAGAVNALWALGSLVPGGPLVRGLSRTARVGRAMKGTGKAYNVLGKAKGITAPVRNMVRGIKRPFQQVGNKFIAGMAKTSPTINHMGDSIFRGATSMGKGLTKLQGGNGSLYSQVVSQAAMPALGLSMIYGGDSNSSIQPPAQVARAGKVMDPVIRGLNSNQQYKYGSVKTAQSITVGGLIQSIMKDPSLSSGERQAGVDAVRRAFPLASPYTVITANTAGAAGAAVAWLVSRYMGLSTPIRALSSVAGFGLGRALYDKLSNPYPGFKQIQ